MVSNLDTGAHGFSSPAPPEASGEGGDHPLANGGELRKGLGQHSYVLLSSSQLHRRLCLFVHQPSLSRDVYRCCISRNLVIFGRKQKYPNHSPLPLFHFLKMKYVRPCSLLNVMHKKAKEMSKRGVFGEFSTLFGVNISEDFISIGTTVPRKRTPLLYGIIERKDQDILGIANELRCMNFTENVAGYVIGLPGTLKNENPEVCLLMS
ncbi:hypothetical protein EZV62_023580 [Acer yangbiense]|uniref:Uncharacterized protein n=1 Tax=Acer yangbiense TaxID=1000413 RepID=A0A5C7H4B1_9ROSI|nr:hypothetical protein EZV62_023580 [Acer yangbiense]